jgi:hypothetical protein
MVTAAAAKRITARSAIRVRMWTPPRGPDGAF